MIFGVRRPNKKDSKYQCSNCKDLIKVAEFYGKTTEDNKKITKCVSCLSSEEHKELMIILSNPFN